MPSKPKWVNAFLKVLSQTGNVTMSASASGMARNKIYEYAKRHPEFQARWDEALDAASDFLEREAYRRAVAGVDEPVVFQGRIQTKEVVNPQTGMIDEVPVTIKKYSDALLMTLLRGAKPEKYASQKQEISGPGGGPIKVTTNEDADAEIEKTLKLIQGGMA